MSKTFVCTCEDVTENDIINSIKQGYVNIEEVKRYTGFGTGYCQGKQCVNHVAKILVKHNTDNRSFIIKPFTVRAPLYPTALRQLAQYYTGSEDE